MKINQFAYIPTPHDQIIAELKATRFLDANNLKLVDPLALFRDLLLKYFSENISATTRVEKLRNLMATEDTDANSYTNGGGSVARSAFYNIGLQLLGFLDGLDFTLSDPLGSMAKLGLPTADVPAILSRDQVIDAWYRLLNTRNKYGQLLIDYIAGRGYYHQFCQDSNFKKPLFFNGKAQAVFDTDKLIREVVYVESSLDTDHDGHPVAAYHKMLEEWNYAN